MNTGSGSQIENEVGLSYRLFVVLHHDDRVPQIAQSLERLQQSPVVTLMESDGWFIQHVQHAGQLASDLSGQANALCFASGQSSSLTIQRQVVQSDGHHESEPGVDFLQDLDRYHLFSRGQRQVLEEGECGLD